MKGSVIVIASYPRSGNSWLMRFLRYFAEGRGISSFGLFPGTGVEPFGNVPGGLTLNENGYADVDAVLNSWPEIERSAPSALFYKTHNMRAPMLPAGMRPKTVYLVRDPIRVFISHLNFLAKKRPGTGAKDIDLLTSGEINNGLADFVEFMGFRQGAKARGSWAKNAQFWTDSSQSAVVSRYEDRMANPVAEHTAILEALGLNPEPGEVGKALSSADPAPPHTVRLGSTDAYVESALDPAMVQRFRVTYRSILEPFGYA